MQPAGAANENGKHAAKVYVIWVFGVKHSRCGIISQINLSLMVFPTNYKHDPLIIINELVIRCFFTITSIRYLSKFLM